MIHEDFSKKNRLDAGKEISVETGITPEGGSLGNVPIPKEQPQPSINLVEYNIEKKTTPIITANYNSNKEKLNEAVEQCKKDPKNTYNLAYLKRLIDLYEPTLDPINSFLIKLLSIGPFGKANDTYNEMLNELTENQKKQTQILVKSFVIPQLVEVFHVPEGWYSGPVKNGLPHTDPNADVSSPFSKGTLSNNSLYYAGEFKEGKIDGKGIVLRPGNKGEPPIKYEGLFENGIYRGKIIRWNQGEYAGPTRSEANDSYDIFKWNSKEDIIFNGSGQFSNEKIAIQKGLFKNDTLIKGTVTYQFPSKEEPLIVTEEKPFAELKTGKWTYIGQYSTLTPHGENGVFYRDKERWEGNFEDGFLKSGTKLYADGTREDGTFVNNELETGVRLEGKIFYKINKTIIWQIDYPDNKICTGTFNKIGNSYLLNGDKCVKEYTLNGVAYTEEGTFENGIFKEGIRRYKSKENIDVSEEGMFEINGNLVQGKVSKTDDKGITTVYETIKNLTDSYSLEKSERAIRGKFGQNLVLEGEGKITRSDGTSEEGNFKDNKLNGPGRIVIKNKNGQLLTITGTFENGELIAKTERKATYTPDREQGRIDKYGQLQGLGTIQMDNAPALTGNFKDNLPHGKMITKVHDNKWETKYYIEGELSNETAWEEYKKNKPDQI